MAQQTPTTAVTVSKTANNFSQYILYVVLFLVDAGLVWFTAQLIKNGYYPLTVVFVLIIALINFAFLSPKAKPYRWMAIGLSALLLFSIFPIFYTIYNAFTNYGDGHLITREQAITQIERKTYLPEGGQSFSWIAYRKADKSDYFLFLKDKDGNTQLVVPVNSPLAGEELTLEAGQHGITAIGDDGAPVEIEGYTKLNKIIAATDNVLNTLDYGNPENPVRISSPNTAAQMVQQFVMDPETGNFVDQESGLVYRDVEGTWTASGGRKLVPGYSAVVGMDNFVEFVTSPALRGPLVTIVIWNFTFAFFSVFLTFSVGLAISILFGDEHFKGKKIVRSLLLIPYTIPSLITILIWRGMLNPDIGVVNRILQSAFGISPDWFNNYVLARIAIIVVNLWLGYPYFMLVTSGALQSIPSDIYEAAEVDGATGWQRFWNITLPLLLVSVGPLMIASFIFNFNNFNLIYLFIAGGPPIPSAGTAAGYTDILISYVYNLAFAGGRGVNYGYASAISIFVFVIVAVLSLVQFKFTNMWEEVGENV